MAKIFPQRVPRNEEEEDHWLRSAFLGDLLYGAGNRRGGAGVRGYRSAFAFDGTSRLLVANAALLHELQQLAPINAALFGLPFAT